MKKNNKGTIVIVSILVSFLAGVFGAYLLVINSDLGQNVIKNVTESKYTETSISKAVDKIYDAVVVVEAYKQNTLYSTGTGFVYKKSGSKAYVMTNNHVVDGASEIKLVLSNNDEIDAKVLGRETYSDMAILEVDADKILAVASLGNTDDIKAGDTVFTVGSPEGAEYFGTVTKGVLSAKDRLVAVSYSGSTSDYYMRVLQTDAAINPGNSGGPICDVSGNVIGITSMKLVDDSVEGMGFAIPIEDALYYAETLEKGKEIVRPFFGISMMDINTNNAFTLWQAGVTIPDDVNEGVVVLEVTNNSPASKAGLQKGDIILQLADEKITSVAKFRYELYKHEVGEKVEVTYMRDGKIKTKTVTLSENSNK